MSKAASKKTEVLLLTWFSHSLLYVFRVQTREGHKIFEMRVHVFWVDTLCSDIPAKFAYHFAAEQMGERKIVGQYSRDGAKWRCTGRACLFRLVLRRDRK